MPAGVVKRWVPPTCGKAGAPPGSFPHSTQPFHDASGQHSARERPRHLPRGRGVATVCAPRRRGLHASVPGAAYTSALMC